VLNRIRRIPNKFRLAILLLFGLMMFNIWVSHAASTLTSITFSDITIFDNNCALGMNVYAVEVIVTGVSDSTNFTITEHFEGVGHADTAVFVENDSQLGAVIDLGITFNGTGWTAPGDKPQVFVEATANGVTVTTPVIEIDCATGTHIILGGSNNVEEEEEEQDFRTVFTDGRLNKFDNGNPVVVYGQDMDGGRGLVVYSPDGQLLLAVTPEEIAAVPKCPDTNTLIASNDTGVALYRLAESCAYQINAPTGEAGKTYVLIFNSLFADTGYTSFEE